MSTEQPWRRVYTALRQDIDQGRLRPGDQITSTRALAEEHGVAPMTVRRALAELQDLGVATPTHGVGWFVTTPPEPEPGLTDRVDRLEREVRELRERLDLNHDSTVT